MHQASPQTRVSQTPAIPQVISSLLEGAVATLETDRRSARGYLVKALTLLRARDEAGHRTGEPHLVQPNGGLAAWQVNRVVDFIESNLTEKMSGAALAAQIGVSLGQLFRGFKTSVGITPFAYITKRRIDLACHLMKTTREPLAQVAIASGHCDQSQFCRVFRRTIGASPAKWRRDNALGPATAATSSANLSSREQRQQHADRYAQPGSLPIRQSLEKA